ncbi:hypothetical protein JMA_27390 [Jeotgalibacillus malaysiensis]|uniref:Uncharacterized protein n=1 Tax=Jeotgalibacillus malaysiensis TaxID=1508404 RepID=A0A0B5APM7_9BACL|nr:hypothetical protein [Jeotgalibacillus malaysiensis]AJD92056.1 hypothetical protein JMA_27390 [Jeotgalibacillus malaysiensis]
MCNHCNGHGATYKFHSYGKETIPCLNSKCQERNLKQAEESSKQTQAKINEACERFGIDPDEFRAECQKEIEDSYKADRKRLRYADPTAV